MAAGIRLRDRLKNLPFAVAGSIDAPELGDGEKIHLARLSFGEREEVSKIAKDKELDPMIRIRSMLAIVVCEEDGHPAFESSTDEAINDFPAVLADRAVEAALGFNTGKASEQKKPSAPTES